MVDDTRNTVIMKRGRQLLALKILLVAFIAAYLNMYELLNYNVAVPALSVAIGFTGVIFITAPALAKGRGYGRWTVATALGWLLISIVVALLLNTLPSLSWVTIIESLIVKVMIVALTFKTYLDFLIFRLATHQPS